MPSAQPLYDDIGRSYATTRRPDPRIAKAIRVALGDASTVANIGAGTGSYEPDDLDVVAIEPSAVMIAQRPTTSASALQGSAEHLPLETDSVDAAMAIISDHHWTDRLAGLTEMRRVARQRVVIVNAHPGMHDRLWLTRDYLPTFLDLIPGRYRRDPTRWETELRRALGPLDVHILPVPHDCVDGFYQAYWRRPHAYLDDEVRTNISVFQRLPASEVDRALERLRHDLRTGVWAHRNHSILSCSALDVGLRIVVGELS